MNEPITTAWTPGGHRVIAVAGNNGVLVVTCQSETHVNIAGTHKRQLWTLAQLIIPSGVTRSEGRRAVGHWLTAYDDDDLEVDGVKAFLDLYAQMEAVPLPEAGGEPGPQGPLN